MIMIILASNQVPSCCYSHIFPPHSSVIFFNLTRSRCCGLRPAGGWPHVTCSALERARSQTEKRSSGLSGDSRISNSNTSTIIIQLHSNKSNSCLLLLFLDAQNLDARKISSPLGRRHRELNSIISMRVVVFRTWYLKLTTASPPPLLLLSN